MITLFIINVMFKMLCWLTYAGVMVAAVVIDFCINFVYGFISSFINSFITEYRKAKQKQKQSIQGPPALLILNDGTLNPDAIEWLKIH